MENKTVPMCKTCQYLKFTFTTSRTDEDALKRYRCTHPKANSRTLPCDSARRNVEKFTKSSPKACPLRQE